VISPANQLLCIISGHSAVEPSRALRREGDVMNSQVLFLTIDHKSGIAGICELAGVFDGDV